MPGPIVETPLFTSRELRNAMGRFVTGVTVVTAMGADGPHGVTVNSFTSLSLEPPLVLFCLGAGSRSGRIISAAGMFAVNILSREQDELGRWFATSGRPSGPSEFAGVAYRSGVTRAPLLEHTVGYVECALDQVMAVGDHTILIGQVLDLSMGDRRPLAFYRGGFHGVA